MKTEDDFGNAVYHRGTVFQDTFAKYAYFSNSENGIYFGGGDQVFGPVHSNDIIRIAPSGVEFHDPVTTAKTIVGAGSGIFDKGYTQSVPNIAMPTTKVFGQLASLAVTGQTKINGGLTGGTGEATTRIEFIGVDLNGDGNTTDPDEGFMRVWSSNALSGAALVKAAKYNAAAFTQFSVTDADNAALHPTGLVMILPRMESTRIAATTHRSRSSPGSMRFPVPRRVQLPSTALERAVTSAVIRT